VVLPGEPELAAAVPETIHTELYHLPASLTIQARRRTLRIDRSWLWSSASTTAWQHAAQLPART